MKCLIVGGAGFIGLNIAESLLAAGVDCTLFGPGLPREGFIQGIRDKAQKEATLDLIQGDVRNKNELAALLDKYKFDAVICAAAITASRQKELERADQIASVNIGGALNVLAACEAAQIRRVILLSSGSVFGVRVPRTQPLLEDDRPWPDTLYGLSKVMIEEVAARYNDSGSLNVNVIRLGVCFGPWEFSTGVRDTLSLPLQLWQGISSQTRSIKVPRDYCKDWIYSRDVGAVLARVVEKGLPKGLYHLSSGEDWSLQDWAQSLRCLYSELELIEVDDAVEKPAIGVERPSLRARLDVTKLDTALGGLNLTRKEDALAEYRGWLQKWY